jgi:plasmid stabilization system protein ParE
MTKPELVLKEDALKQLESIRDYIIANGNPLNAKKFTIRMIEFIYSLNQYPTIHSPCRYKKFKARNWNCAVFENNYIIAYKIFKFKVVVHAVINIARLQ